MSLTNYPDKYLLYNERMTKNLCLVMQIEGVDTIFGISDTYTAVRYGDSGIVFGETGLVYGGLRKLSNLKSYIVLDQGMTISQKIEPEQGRGNVGTLTITLIDRNGEVSELISPGVVIDEIMGNREVKIWLGFTQTSYPEDYLLIYRGYVTSIDCPPGVVKLQISDATSKKKQPIFDTPTTTITGDIDAVVTTIPVVNTPFFYDQILGPDGTHDPIVRTYIQVDSEWMEYGPGDLGTTSVIVQRGSSHSLGTTPDSHSLGASVSNGLQLGGNVEGVNAITLALKVMLSGWNGPCETGIEVAAFVYTLLPSLGFKTNAFVLASDDALLDLGLTIGDYFTISGATNSGNNVTGQITGFDDSILPNRVIYTNQTFTLENPTSATCSFRSKYDTLPIGAGIGLRMRDVDVPTFEYIRDTYFTSDTGSNMQFFFDQSTDGKSLIDTQIMLPIGCYSISRYGRISMSITKPPLPGGFTKLIDINWTNVINPDQITVSRATNARNFFNLVTFEYDKQPSGDYSSISQFLDTDSLNLFDITSKLPITADGLQTAVGGATIAQTRGTALLNRYKKCALQIDLTVNWSVGSLIEVSDIVLLRDEGKLQIMNFETGKRDLGVGLFEVIDREYAITAGSVKLTLLGGLGFTLDSRFALYSPSSVVGEGSTTSMIRITPSYGQSSIDAEKAKWTKFTGLTIRVHTLDETTAGSSVITGFLDTDSAAILIDPPLSFVPTAGLIVDIDNYPTDTDKTEAQLYKTLYTHITPTVAVASGTSGTVFDVSSGDIGKFTVGNTVIVRSNDFSTISDEIAIESISGTTITLAKNAGFTPNNTYFVEGIGFHDGTGFYRLS